ncbi:MAG: cupin [Alphaproteobacteria bacterium HGW-Alphaproteobacteria-18]|nr:MAG: cupin [Alphaproteobacteria bacterium HGW-Alphaproteobacteria-18]
MKDAADPGAAAGNRSETRAAPCPVITLSDLPMSRQTNAHDAYGASFAAIAAPAGATRLGARLVEILPGKRAWPLHAHQANDEMFVILHGRGVLRLGPDEWVVQAGDVAICPAGGAGTAHQLVAGRDGLRYIAISSMHAPDVILYPDSGKIGIFAGSAPGGDKAKRSIEAIWKLSDAVDYWKDE